MFPLDYPLGNKEYTILKLRLEDAIENKRRGFYSSRYWQKRRFAEMLYLKHLTAFDDDKKLNTDYKKSIDVSNRDTEDYLTEIRQYRVLKKNLENILSFV